MIRTLTKFLVPGVAALALAPAVNADGREPGSVLVFPIHRSSFAGNPNFFTIVSVTNTNLAPAIPGVTLGGSTSVKYDYVNKTVSPTEFCSVIDRVQFLTPADTLSVLTNCHNPAPDQEGFLVVAAQDPALFKSNWKHDHLVGSELVVNAAFGMYSLNAVPFKAGAMLADGAGTDSNTNGLIDFDGTEYEQLPDELIIDTFLAVDNASSLTLLDLSGNLNGGVNVAFDIWNDDEVALSATFSFVCWNEDPLSVISLVFSSGFLNNNTVDDDSELDLTCNNIEDLETGWATIRGVNGNPGLLGAITSGPFTVIDGGHLLWESVDKQDGSFFTL